MTELAPLVFVAKQLADELAATLAGEGRACVRLVVVAETEHGERSERVWYRASGLSAVAMVERVRWQLDGWINQPGEVSAGTVLLGLGIVAVVRHPLGQEDPVVLQGASLTGIAVGTVVRFVVYRRWVFAAAPRSAASPAPA